MTNAGPKQCIKIWFLIANKNLKNLEFDWRLTFLLLKMLTSMSAMHEDYLIENIDN